MLPTMPVVGSTISRNWPITSGTDLSAAHKWDWHSERHWSVMQFATSVACTAGLETADWLEKDGAGLWTSRVPARSVDQQYPAVRTQADTRQRCVRDPDVALHW